MHLLRIVPDNTKFDFIRFRRFSFPMSALLSLVAITLYFTHGLNFGIDFSGGTLIEVQNKAVDVVVKANHPDTVKFLVDVLKDENEYARRAAVEVLNVIGCPKDVKYLLEVIADSDWWVRTRAADALGKIGGPKVVDAVLTLIKDENQDIRRAAISFAC